ncbi:hypothetical protein [Pleurocapsa sp. FMAR1]|uniref:hypothetical protein n=1 Tax=Pleurocapsa sp. FMAR1 TaxID=3040204 RepID=UPI0029C782F0|nr:hypothetical protein [Pleurocapsa sp. FMAR1]
MSKKNDASTENNQEESQLSPDTVKKYVYLFKQLENHPDPEIREIVDLAKKGKPFQTIKTPIKEKLFYLFFANPEEYYGRTFVTDDIKASAVQTAGAVSVSNLTDFASNFPVLFFAFTNIGLIPCLVVSSSINYFILLFGNYTAAAVSRGHKNSRSWSRSAAAGLISLNILQSLVSGVGMELFNNQSNLKQMLASQLIEEQKAKVDSLKDSKIEHPGYDDYMQECTKGRQQLLELPANDPRRHTLYVRILGEYKDKDRDWSAVNFEKLPICHRLTRLEQENVEAYKQAKEYLDSKLIIRSKMGNDLVFLKQKLPDVYNQSFQGDNDEIISGVTAVAISMDSFFGRLIAGDFFNLGLSLYFFLWSIISSTAFILMTIQFARRKDVAKSFDKDLELKRDMWLNRLLEEAIEDSEDVNNINLSSTFKKLEQFADEMNQPLEAKNND